VMVAGKIDARRLVFVDEMGTNISLDDPRVGEGAAALRGSVGCSDCPKWLPGREMVEVTEEHESLTWFPGDLLCRECARGHGILSAVCLGVSLDND
jgi:hypothetical protein